MEMAVTISLRVSIDDQGANLNEICAAVRQAVAGELPAGVARVAIEALQESRIAALVSGAAAEHGAHGEKGEQGRSCPCRDFRRQGFRSRERRVKSDVGEIGFRVGYVECRGCGRRWAPVLDVLGLGSRVRHSAGLERIVCEAVAETSYERGCAEVEGRGCAPVPRSSGHRWVVGRDLPESPAADAETGMADATVFKKHAGEYGQLRVVVGLDRQKRPIPLGCYTGKTWREITEDVKRKLREAGDPQLRLFTTDGELGLDDHLASTLASSAQRCTWHLPRDLYYALWKSGAGSRQRREFPHELAGLVAVELPAGSWEALRPEDREALEREVNEKRAQIEAMIATFREKGYWRAVSYLENALGRVFSHVELWLQTGIVAPRTTSILENILREIGRRMKKIAYNWRDKGAARMGNLVMLRHYDQPTWDAYWKQTLDLRDRCRIRIESIQCRAA